VILFGFGYVAYMIFVKGRQWQNQFQDYRVLAEALRVQVFWCLANMPYHVGDHYLYKHRAELGWIRYALRGLVPWSTGLVHLLGKPHRDLVRQGWIIDQRDYYARAARRNHVSAARSRKWAYRALKVGFGTAVILLCAELASRGELPWVGVVDHARVKSWIGCEWLTMDTVKYIVKDLHHVAVIVMGAMPAMAAFFGLSSEIRAYEGHAQGYDMMHGIFSRALAVERITAGDDEAFRHLVFELGKEALNETAGWLMDHRHRPIENRVG